MNKTLDATLLRYVGYGLMFLVGAYLLYAVRDSLPIFMVSGLLAYAFEPIVQRMEKRGSSRGRAVGFIFLCFLLLLAILFALLATAWQQVQMLLINVDLYQQQALKAAQGLQARFEALPMPDNVRKTVLEFLPQLQTKVLGAAPDTVRNFVEGAIGSIGRLMILGILLPLITFSMMLEMNPMRARAMMMVPPAYRRDVTEIGQKINEVLGRYVRGQMVVCALFGLLCTIAFEILAWRYQMGYPLILGLLAALIYIVPYVGMLTIAIAAGATAYFTAAAPNNILCAVLAVGSCVVINLITDYGVSPRVLGKGVGLHPLMIIFALLSGFSMGGIPGMILAVPLFASLRVILIYIFPQLTAPIPATPPESNMKPSEKSVANVTNKVMQQIETAQSEV
ncbi:MAG TPA: AI-2E family transporter [Abditibacteriaceae bacterium]|jgi:predicted PurR-regulated permease PerM|nr:AI-2E family transporter [Abditibacteriaceae bacterium]